MKYLNAGIFFDVDQALTRSDGTISDWVERQLYRFVEGGGTVSLVTGRPYSPTLNYVIERSHAKYVITHNGAQSVNPETGEMVYSTPIDQLHVEFVMDICEKYGISVITDDGVSLPTNNPTIELPIPNNARLESEIVGLPLRKVSLDDMRSMKHLKLLLMDADSEKLSEVFGLIVAQGISVTKTKYDASGTKNYWLEVANGDKGKAVEDIISRTNLKFAVPVGDSGNDLPMFREYDGVKTVGVAVKNATPELKARAQIVLPYTNDEDAARFLVDIVSDLLSNTKTAPL